HGPNVPPWMRELTRDGLNTILRKFDRLRVYARQKIDFVCEKRGLTEIEAAETLGMSKMLSATIDTDGAVVTLDLEVVDVSSGLLEASERVQGPQEKFMELQTQLAVAALCALGVEPTADQMQEIVASRGNETLDAYRLLRDTLGEALATFTREDTFVDVGSGRHMRLEVRISGILTKQQGAWKIQGLRDPE